MLGQLNRVGNCRRPWVAVTLLVVVLTAACNSSSTVAPGTPVQVTESDFEIAIQTDVKAGDVSLFVHNKGPDDHELIVVRADGGDLPMRTDGLTVAEEAFEPVGVLEPGAPGARRRLDLHLEPGRYELFCNMSGHFLGGMHEILVAS